MFPVLNVAVAFLLSVFAVPAITLDVSIGQRGKAINISLLPASSAAGCSYSITAGGDRRRLRKLARIAAAEAETQRTLTGLRRFRDPRRSRRNVYFRARIRCEDGMRRSAIERITLPSRKGGITPLSRWVSQLESKLTEIVIRLEAAFPALEFTAPIALVSARDGSGRLFMVEQAGRITSFQNNDSVSTSETFLDIRSRVVSEGELGLLGLAFHPRFSENGQFFLNYTEARPGEPSDARTVISRFTLSSPSAITASDATEQRLLVIDQPFSNHNGGDLHFGNDGYLYIALGDGGSGGDPLGNGQNRATLLGKVLRVDVDASQGQLNYGIPSANPFVGNTSGFREEIFAYGFRNPYRMGFDSATGKLWVGDVGQATREEIDIVESGKNYGWNVMEGSLCFPIGSACDQSGLTLPVVEYGRDVGKTIIGGFVYRGSAIPSLAGTYVFADFISGKIFGLPLDGNASEYKILLEPGHAISSLGQDENRELLILSYGEGKIYRILGE